MTKQQIANPMLKDFPWDGTELAAPLTLPGALLASSYYQQAEIITPSAPPAGSIKLYAKSDHHFYTLDSAGSENIISGTTKTETDSWYLPLSGGTLTGPLTVTGALTTDTLVVHSSIQSDVDFIAGGSYRWGVTDPEALYREMPGRLRLSGAQLTVDQNVNVGTYTQLGEIISPVTPNAGFLRLYGKSDHRLYIKDTSGAEAPLLTQTLGDTLYDPLHAASTGDASHVAASDPHPVYLTAAEGDARYAVISGGPGGTYLTDVQADTRYVRQDGTKSMTGNLIFSPDNTVDIGATGARPRDLLLGRDIAVGRNLTAVGATVSGSFTVGDTITTPQLYFGSSADSISLTTGTAPAWLFRATDDRHISIATRANVNFSSNAYYDGTNWKPIVVANPASMMYVAASGIALQTAPANAVGTTLPWVLRWNVDSSGNMHAVGKLQLDGGIIWMGPNQPATPDLGLYSTTGANWMRLANAAMPIKFYVDAAASNNWIGSSPMGEFNTNGFSISGSMYYGGQPFITWGGEQLQWAATGGQFRWVNQNNTVQWMVLDTGANLSVAGQVIAGSYVSAYAGVWSNSYYIGSSGSYYINVSSNICQIVNMNLLSWGWVGLAANGGIYINYDGIGISHTHQIRGPSLYVSGRLISNNWDIGSSNSLGGELYVNGGITLYANSPLYMESGRNVYIQWRGDLRSVYVPYDLGLYTTRVMMNRLDWEGSRQVYFNWDGSNVTMNMSGPWGFGAPNLFAGTTNTMNIVCSYGAAGGYICWQDSNVRLLRTGNQILWWVYDGVWDFRSTASGNQAGYIDMSGFHSTSKRRYKTDITPIKDGLKLVLDKRVTPIRYAIKGYGILSDKPSLGFIAEDMAHVVPNAVGRDEEGPSSINYGSLVAVLWDAVRTLNTRVEELEEKLAA